MNKKICVPLIGTGIEKLNPDVSKLTELLLAKGFRPLTKESSQKLPIGSLVLIHSGNTNSLSFALVQKHLYWNNAYLGFNYVPNSRLQPPCSTDMARTFDNFNQKFYLVLGQVNVIDGIPQVDKLPELLKEIGFKPLAEAVPEDVSSGDMVFLYENTGRLTPIIIRELSHQFANDHRLLFWKQSPIVIGEWQSDVLMEHLTPFKNYEYFVF